MGRVRTPAVRHAVGVALVVALAALVAVPEPTVWTALALALVALAVGAGRAGVRRGAAALLLAVGLTLLGGLLGVVDLRLAASDGLFTATRAGIPWLVGLAWRGWREARRQAVASVADERRERRRAAERARDAERIALAESLHDDLGHALSLVALNLGRLELDPALAPVQQEAVTTARLQVAQAVERLGSSVTSLRSGTTPGLRPPSGVDALVEQARRAGADVRVASLPTPERLARFDGALVSRLLQEALTNALRHAPGTPVDVEMTEAGNLLHVTVRNVVVPSHEKDPGSGTGLASLARHLESAGGHLDVRRGHDEFALVATLPEARPVAVSDGVAGDEDELAAAVLDRAARRGSLIVVSAAVAVIAVLGLVEAVTVWQARRASVPAADLARVEVGATRDEVAHLLPGHELLGTPGGRPDVDCHDYALAAGPFDDAFGDVVRVCFQADVVASVERLPAGER